MSVSGPEGGFPSQAALEARYGLPASRFADIGGVRLHFCDEGSGPTIILLHGSYASLRQWDDWAIRLKTGYRVVRFDWPAYGLSDAMPDGDYSAASKLALIAGLADLLGIDRFTLVATSSAGVPGVAFAAACPDRVAGLIVNNIGVGPVQHDEAAFTPELQAVLAEDATHPGWHRPAFWREILRMNYADPARVSDAVVTRWTELNNRQFPAELRPDPAQAAAEFARTIDDLPCVTVPTLVLWSDTDREVPLEREGRLAFDLLGTTDKTLVVIPDAGHMMPEECGARGLDCAMPFLARVAVD